MLCRANRWNCSTCGCNGESEKAFELYRWFLPLLRMDTVPKFVQLIKLVQAEVGIGNSRVRPPRLELAGEELEQDEKNYSRCIAVQAAGGEQLCVTGRKIDMASCIYDENFWAIADRVSGSGGAGETLYATNPATGERLEPGFVPATAEEVDLAVRLGGRGVRGLPACSGTRARRILAQDRGKRSSRSQAR